MYALVECYPAVCFVIQVVSVFVCLFVSLFRVRLSSSNMHMILIVVSYHPLWLIGTDTCADITSTVVLVF